MAMTTCPYCNTEVRESLIEADDGCCPECGAMISTRSALDEDYDDFDDYVRDDFDEDLFDDVIGDEFDDDFEEDLEDFEEDL